MTQVRLGDHLVFSIGAAPPSRDPSGRCRIYGSNGPIGYTAQHNAVGPLIVIGRVGSYCGSLRYCDSDVWVTDNAMMCRAKDPDETRFWYYALQACGLNEHRAGSGQPLLNKRILRDITVRDVPARDRGRIADLLGALDDKIAANRRVITAAESLMVATGESVLDYVPLSALANQSTAFHDPRDFHETVALFSFSAFDDGAQPERVTAESVKSGKFVLRTPCVLFAKLNPKTPRIWNVPRLPLEMALASAEFVVLQPIDVDTSALWAALRQPDVLAPLQQQVAGTSGSRQRINPDDLLAARVPDMRCLSAAASQTITSLGLLCHERRAESRRLAALRDAMLPALMSGEVVI